MLPLRVVLSAEALFQEIGGEAVILDLASSAYFGLDEVGARFWRLLQSDPSVQAACSVLLSEYEVERAQIEQDLDNLVCRLVEAGLAKVE